MAQHAFRVCHRLCFLSLTQPYWFLKYTPKIEDAKIFIFNADENLATSQRIPTIAFNSIFADMQALSPK